MSEQEKQKEVVTTVLVKDGVKWYVGNVRLEVNGLGFGGLWVDGEMVLNVGGVTIEVVVGQPPVMTVKRYVPGDDGKSFVTTALDGTARRFADATDARTGPDAFGSGDIERAKR